MQRTNRKLIWLALGLLIAGIAVIVIQLTTSPNAIITVEWTTASELNTAGFNLYRSESKDGPYTRLNTDLIPGSTDPLTGGSYAYTDTQVIAGHTYFYQLEDVEIGGNATRHDPYEVTANVNLGSSLYVTIGLVGAAILLGVIGLTSGRTSKASPHG